MFDSIAMLAAPGDMPITAGHFWELIFRLLVDVIVVFILIRFAYQKNQDSPSYVFTFALFNVLIFFVVYLLSNASMSIGFAFGLFAVFAILRYRTKTIPIKEMTYLFLFITLGLANALRTSQIGIAELLLVNSVIVAGTLLAERIWDSRAHSSVRVRYDRVDNIHPDKRGDLIEDLKQRTGLNIHSIRVSRIDLKRGTARVRINYHSDDE